MRKLLAVFMVLVQIIIYVSAAYFVLKLRPFEGIINELVSILFIMATIFVLIIIIYVLKKKKIEDGE